MGESQQPQGALKDPRDAARILDNLLEGCQIIDRDWRYVYVNEAVVRQGRMPREKLIGASMVETYPGIENTPMFSILRRCMADRIPDRMENEFRFPDGSLGSFYLIFEPVPEGVLILSLEYTEQRRIEEQLRQAQKLDAVGQLAGGIAHDFNNLLTVITLYSGRLLSGLPQADPRRASVEQIAKAGERAADLTRQLLAFSRRQMLEPKVLDLNAILADTGKMLRRLIGEDITLAIVSAPGLGRVKADPGQIEQVIMNLVINARDAMPRGGRVTLETADVQLDETYARSHIEVVPGDYVMLAVSDTGSGMDRATQARIFEPFFTTKDPGKGTGLGLATVFGIVKQSGGSIWVYSEPGQGTSFKVYLPRIEQELSEEKPHEAPSPKGTETVILLEDEEMVREITVAALRDLGYQVLPARTGEEAVELCRERAGDVDLLITDVIMPGMGGPKATEVIRAVCPAIKVLYMSGYTDDVMVRHGLLNEKAAFLQKPFTMDALAKKTREVLSQ